MQPLTGTFLFFFLLVKEKNGDNETSKLVYFILITFIEVSVILLCGYSGNCVEIMIFGVSDFQRNTDWWNPFPSSSLELSSPPA